ncbi:TonB-dependent receptor plug domain-containing protein [Draconibacterium sp. IB214405]|uniref:TonB-dependent receptor n=1 Tax=Draconibacterium sp. IB214405 TaxID=3097352 RepID=UPI002A106D54|nr:TonB-dependent receptor plug domain-containing protein [Draconibacterium sp. IB214405]MDX8337599.1 TonB-dependent receptor plug domain-containing protein [Draconibacterium sp. IB214405]
MFKNLTPIVVLLLFVFSATAQSIENYVADQPNGQIQKLYLHTDREFYFWGDTLWFSAYLVNGQNHTYFADSLNMHVELIDKEGEIVRKELLMVVNGFSKGYLSFNDNTLEEGNYLLRAYTDFMQVQQPENLFNKTITISAVKNKFPEDKAEDIGSKVYIDFLPEGGILLNEKINRVAFKAYNRLGKSVDVKGTLFTMSGKKVADIESSFQGLGVLFFKSQAGEKYKIELDDDRQVSLNIPEVSEIGSKLALSLVKKNGIQLRVESTEADDRPAYLVCMHRGMVNNYIEIPGSEKDKLVDLKNDVLSTGINRLVLVNSDLQPVSERLYFKTTQDEFVNIEVSPNKEEYSTREEIELDLKSETKLTKGELARVSMTVINKDLLLKNGNAQTIQSYLLLDSELNGPVDNAAAFFKDSENIESAEKLDLLMLTSGWSSYSWNNLKSVEEMPEIAGAGLQFKGKVRKLVTQKPFADTDVLLNIIGKEGSVLFNGKTNETGDFLFDNVEYFDTALVIIQGLNNKDKRYTNLELAYPGQETFEVSEKELDHLGDREIVSVGMYRQKYQNELKLSEFYPDRNTRILEEIKVVRSKSEFDDGHYRPYPSPSHSIQVEDWHSSYVDVFQFIKGRFPNVWVTGDHVRMRGTGSIYASTEPLYLLDGFTVQKDVIKNIPMVQIDKVEVIKGPFAAILGMNGANGVISILTRTEVSDNYTNQLIAGTFVKRINGFQKYREFYSPRYTVASDSEIPDYRQTLYWNPAMLVDDKSQNVSFFSCDNLANYKIFVEGITTTGKICIGEADFVVNKRNLESF